MKTKIKKMSNTHSITIGLYIKAGRMYEKIEEAGISNFVMNMFFRGVNSLDQIQLYKMLESIGTTLEAKVYDEYTRFSLKIRKEYFYKAMDIMFGIINTKFWSQPDIESEKKLVLNRLDDADGSDYLESTIRRVLYKDTPLSQKFIGNRESISGLNCTVIDQYIKTRYNSDMMYLCVTGDISMEQMKYLEYTIPISDNIADNSILSALQFVNISDDRIICIYDKWKQLDVDISFISYDKGPDYELLVLNNILGETPGSKLELKIREEKGYTSNIDSYIEFYKEFSIMHIRFSINEKHIIPVITDIIEVLNNLKTGISYEDIKVAMALFKSDYEFIKDDSYQMNRFIAYNEFILESDIKATYSSLFKITPNKIEKKAKKLFQSYNAKVIILGNTNRINENTLMSILKGLNNGLGSVKAQN